MIRTSRALSKKLYEAGLKQKSEWCIYYDCFAIKWDEGYSKDWVNVWTIKYSSYTLEELLALVPKKIKNRDYYKYKFTYDSHTGLFEIGAEIHFNDIRKFTHKDPKTAIANLLIWLLDNGYMKRCKV